MAQLGNTPQSLTLMRLEARKSFALSLWFETEDDAPFNRVNLTGCSVRFAVAKRVGGTSVLAQDFVIDGPIGLAKLELQSDDLNIPAKSYDYMVTLLTEDNYSIPVMKGELEIEPNADLEVDSDYTGNNPAQSAVIEMHGNHPVRVKLNGLTPHLTIGEITRLPEGVDPTASITGQYPGLTLNLGIPGWVDMEDVADQITVAVVATVDSRVATLLAAQVPPLVAAAIAAADITGQVTTALASSSTLTAAAIAAVNAAIDYQLTIRDLVQGSDVRMARVLDHATYAFAIVDATDKILFAIKNDGTLVGRYTLLDGTLNVAALSADMLSRIVTPGAGPQIQTVNVEAGPYVLPTVDGAGHVLSYYDSVTGAFTPAKFVLPNNTVTMPKLASDVLAQLPQAVALESGYAFAIVDSLGRIVFGIKLDGTPTGKFPSSVESPAVNASYVAESFLDSYGRTQIRSHNRANGQVAVLTATASNKSKARFTSLGDIVFMDDNGNASGTPTARYVAPGGGSVWTVFPTAGFWAAFGDSLTAGGWPQILAGRIGQIVENWGIGGQTAIQIAARAMGTPAGVTLNGNQIPSGSVAAITVTAGGDKFVRPTDSSAFVPGPGLHNSFKVTIAGVHGTLAVTDLNVYSFTPDVAPATTVSVPPGTTVYTDMGVNAQPHGLLLWLGRNNLTGGTGAADNVAKIQSIIDYNKPLQKRYVALTILPSTDDTPTILGYVAAYSAAIMAAWPDNYVDVASYLRSDQAFTDAGITKTTQDITDIAGGFTPSSFRGDALHLNTIGYTLVALIVHRKMQAKGWVS